MLKPLVRKQRVLHLGRSYDAANPGPHLQAVWGSGQVELDLDQLRQAELETLMRRTRSVFDDDNHHYLLPSGWHAERFIRLGNAASSLPDSRRLADWVLAHLDEHHDLLADTGTILPVLQEVQRHCRANFGWATKIDALAGYPSVETLAAGLEDLRARGGEERGVLFVISVNSSGTARARFETKLQVRDRDRALVLCETDASAVDIASTLVTLPTRRWAPSDEGRCDGCGSTAQVVVNPATYEPTAAYRITPKPITPEVASAGASVFSILARYDAIRLHYTSERGAHYAMWVDTPTVLRQPDQQAAFENHISKMPRPDLVIIPEGPAASELVATASQATGIDPLVVPASGSLPEDVAAAVARSERILIVDDTVVTGTTLGRLRRSIYRAAQHRGRNPQTSAALFLARPSRSADLAAVSRPFRDSRGVNLVPLHQVLMPPSRRCSFCTERLLLRNWIDRLDGDVAEIAYRRLEQLDSDLASGEFLGASSSTRDLVTAGSFFGELQEHVGFAAAASATQQVLDQHSLATGSLQATTIDIGAALDAYFDPCLLVGILRTCRKEEVRFAATDEVIASRYVRLSEFGDALTDAVRCEIVWAALREVIPLSGVDHLLDGVGAPEGALLRALLQLRQANIL